LLLRRSPQLTDGAAACAAARRGAGAAGVGMVRVPEMRGLVQAAVAVHEPWQRVVRAKCRFIDVMRCRCAAFRQGAPGGQVIHGVGVAWRRRRWASARAMAHGARHSAVPRESAVPVMPSRAVLRSVLPGRSVTLRGRLDRSAGEEQKKESRRACQDKVQGAQDGPPLGPRLSGVCCCLAAHRTVGRSRPGPRVPARFSLPPLGQSFLRLLRVVKLSCRL